MEKTNIVKGPQDASRIVLGCYRITKISKDEAATLISQAVDQGINYFDNATSYEKGECEKQFGESLLLSGVSREEIIIQTKCGLHFDLGYFDWSEKDIIKSTEVSLARMKTDYIDVLLLHRPDVIYEPEQVASAFDKLYTSGKVRYFGVSNLMPMQIELLKRYVKQPLVINQLQFSLDQTQLIDPLLYMNNKSTDLSLDRDNSTLDYCRLTDITVQAWSPLQYADMRGTFLNNKDFPELNDALHRIAEIYNVPISTIAIAWILRHPAKMQAITGTMNFKHLQEICAATHVNLTHSEWYELYLAAGSFLP